ncbi:unnamed protein product, partial [Symbiodinium pilosum]
CGRDGIEAATAATAAVRVEAEAKCRELAQRIESLPVPGRWTQDLEAKIDSLVHASLNDDLRCLERRLLAQFSNRHSEVLEAAQQMAAELKAEVNMQLEAVQAGRILQPAHREGSEGSGPCLGGRKEDLESRLRIAEADLRRAMRDVDSMERAYAGPIQQLEQRIVSLEACKAPAMPAQEQRIHRLEADLVKLFQRLGSASPSVGVQDPSARRGITIDSSRPHSTPSVLGGADSDMEAAVAGPSVLEHTLRPADLAANIAAGEPQKPARVETEKAKPTELAQSLKAPCGSVGMPPAPPSPTSPLPNRPVVPFQPPSRRPSRLAVPGPGTRRNTCAAQVPVRADMPPAASSGDIQASNDGPQDGASRDLWDQLLDPGQKTILKGHADGHESAESPAKVEGEVEEAAAPHPSLASASGDQAASNSSSPTLGSANLSEILRSTSALAEHLSGSSQGSHGHTTPHAVEGVGQVEVTRERSSSGSSSGGERRPQLDQRQALEALVRDVAAEPVCAFSTNVSEADEFRSEDELDLPM